MPLCAIARCRLQLVFTRSATGALHDIAEGFPWSRDSYHIYSRANHNSVLGKPPLHGNDLVL